MEKQDDGGPAFPGTTSQPNERGVFYPVQHQCMSLRDAAALAALQGICAHGDTWGLPTSEAIARKAFSIADAFIAARSNGEG